MLTTSTGGTEQSRLSEPAFLGWVHKGTKMTGAKRRAFAKQSESRRAMVLLLRTVEVRARQEIWTPEKNTLHKLFQKFDVDGSGHIDAGELSRMIGDIVSPDSFENGDTTK